MADLVVNILPSPKVEVTIAPLPTKTVAIAIGAPGLTGAAGSDAEVTSENIESALGYVPANPALLSKEIFQGFSVTPYDTSIPTFSGGVLTLFTLKTGGSGGTITNTVAYTYSGGLLTSKVLHDPSGAVLNTMTFTYSGTTLISKTLT
jgi:hypothetical protein